MKIQDLLIETNLNEEQLDELNVAQGINKVSTGLGKAVGGVQGAWQGAKKAFNTQRQQTAANVKQAVANPQQAPATQPGQPAQAVAPAEPVEPTMDPQQAPQQAPADTTAVNPGVPTSDEQTAQANQTTTNPAAAGSRIGGPAGKQAIDNAMKTVGAVRSDRRQGVIDYAQQKLDQAEQELAAIRKNAGIQQAPNLQVQQGGKAPAPAPQQAVA